MKKYFKPWSNYVVTSNIFISPDLYEDPNTKEIKSITLSYTFFDTDNINIRNF